MSTGENLIDKYKLLSPLATGQTTQVWEVTEANSPKRMAMKLLLPEAFKISANKASLKHEFKAGKQFDHPNIIKYNEIVVAKKHAYFIMELFRAPNLKLQIKNDLTMVQVRIKRLIELVCLALEHIHEKGWLHRDVKPDNILFNKGSEVKLIDFSLASPISGALGRMFSKRGPVQGTRTYMAPEQILNKSLTIQTDLYSVGITVFEMLTGKPPFVGGTPKALLMAHLGETPPNPSFYNKNVTPEMDRIVSRLLSKKPENRHKRAAEIWGELRTIDVFKEAVKERTADEIEAEKNTVDLTKLTAEDESRARLDSRLDAKRQEAIRLNPELGVQFEKSKAESKAKRAAETAAATKRVKAEDKSSGKAQPAPAWPGTPAGYPPPMPGMPMPMPGFPPVMPGYGMPPGYVPGPPYPMAPAQMMPPGMAMPPYAPLPGMPPMAMPGAPGVAPPPAPASVAPATPVQTPVKFQPATASPAAPTTAAKSAAPATAKPSATPAPAAKAPAPRPAPPPVKPKPAAKPAPAATAPPADGGFDISALDGFDQLESST